jgi:hypothetical protein
MIQFDLSTIIS